MKILFMVPYPVGEAPSQRFRFEQYFDVLRKNGVSFNVSPFLNNETWNVLYKPGKTFTKLSGIFSGFLKRVGDLVTIQQYDYIFIHREATPLGPPVFEWIIAKIFSKKIIYDFDDAIWQANVSKSNRVFSRLKWYGKVGSICRWAYLVSCGNDFLKDFALQYNAHIIVNPTVVSTERHYNQLKQHKPGKTIIGWTGTHSTIKYLSGIVPVLQKVEEHADVEIVVISDAAPDLPLKTLKFIQWKKISEIEDLLQFDIGIMPLTDDDWTRGKCGFKLIQYLALQIPAVSSPAGVNKKIIDNSESGFLCGTHDEWFDAFVFLIEHPEMRAAFGTKGREKIKNYFSAEANADLFLSMFA